MPATATPTLYAPYALNPQLMYGGFLISYNKLKPFTYLAFYLSPFSWAVRSMADSEFRDERYGAAGAIYDAVFGLQDSDAWMYSGPWALLGAYYLFAGLVLCSAALSLLPPAAPKGTMRLSEYAAARAGHAAGGDAAGSPRGSPQGSPATSKRIDADSPTSSAPASAAATALAFRRVTLAWSEVEYDVFNPRTKSSIQLLHSVSGVAVPGTLTALMGASGAGKTTLMDVLAGRKTQGTIRGAIKVNGQVLSPGAFARVSAYVEQSDVHLGTSTVAEALAFSAALRLETDIPQAARTAFITALLDELELTPLAGRVAATLAPGEQKRLSLGVELASNPSLLFLDEPTTGLDARSAAVVMRVIGKVAARGVTVIATIHQPSAAVFLGFSHLLLLAPGGHVVYGGPIGKKARTLISYFESIPGTTPLPPHTNPATWMLDVIGDGDGHHASDGIQGLEVASPGAPTPNVEAVVAVASAANAARGLRSPRFAESFRRSAVAAEATTAIAASLTAPSSGSEAKAFPSSMATGLLTQFGLVLHRAMLDLWRDPSLQSIRICVFLFVALFMGVTFYQVDRSDQQGVLVTLALIFSTQVFSAIVYLNTSMPRLIKSRDVFYRERAARFYVPEVWAGVSIVKELPYVALFSIIFARYAAAARCAALVSLRSRSAVTLSKTTATPARPPLQHRLLHDWPHCHSACLLHVLALRLPAGLQLPHARRHVRGARA